MKKRTKQNVIYWTQRREKLYARIPASRLVENRYKALQAILREKYPEIADQKDILKFLKDADYNNRKIRSETEGEQELQKKILSQDYQLNSL